MNKFLYYAIAIWSVLMPTTIFAQSEPYAVLSEDNTKLTFYFDDHKTARNGLDVGPFNSNASWDSQKEQIISVVFDSSFAECKTISSTAYWFNGCINLKTITGISNLNTDNVISMRSMFRDCSSLVSLDVGSLKTDNVTNMSLMFRGCSSLTNLDVSGFKTDNVKNMNSMFYNCSAITSLDVSRFKTDNVTDMNCMFYNCSGLTNLDVSKFKTDNVTNMNCMFYNCSGPTILDVSGFITNNVTNMNCMFYNCSGLTILDVSGFKTDSVTNMKWMFGYCSHLMKLDLSGFNTDNVTNMNHLFAYCDNLSTIYASNRWNMSKVEDSNKMFSGCSKLVGAKGTTYNNEHTDGEYARVDAGNIKPGYFTYKDPEFFCLTYMIENEIFKTKYLKAGTTVIPEAAPTKEGYTFSGWRDEPSRMPAHDVVVNGTFSINTYRLKYMVDGQDYKSYSIKYGAPITPEAEPSRMGYTFSGWSEIPETMPARDVTITGTFSINSYKLTYMIDDVVYKEITYKYGATITPEPTPEGDYATFEWVDLPATMPAHDVVVYAKYTSGIVDVMVTDQQGAKRYSIDGKLLDEPKKGINIIRMSNGKAKKIVVK